MQRAMLVVTIASAAMGSAAMAQVGAPVGTPMQAGGWGSGGWQAGAGPAATTTPINDAPAAYPPTTTAAAPSPASAGYARVYPNSYAGAPPAGIGRYKPIAVGKKLPGGYADPIYTVGDWRGYGLAQPYPGTRWVRYFDDAVLADQHGRAIAVRRVAWDAPRHARSSPVAATGQPWTPPVASTRTERHGNTVVTTQVIPPPRAFYGGGYGPDYGWGPGVTVTPSVVTTTTVTTTEPAGPARRATRSRSARSR